MLKPQCQTFCARYYGWISTGNGVFNGILKLVVGVQAGSQALIADGLQSLTDVITGTITSVSLIISRQPRDEKHPYGHGKIEYVMSAVFGGILLVVALVTMGRAVAAIARGRVPPPGWISIGPALISILCSVSVGRYGLCVSRHIQSPVVAASARESLVDALSSAAALAGIIGAHLGYSFLDPAVAILVALLIVRVGFLILKDATNGLMDGSVAESERRRMVRCVASAPGVLRVAQLKTRQTGRGAWADVRIVVPEAMTLRLADRVARDVRNALLRNFPRIQDAAVYLEAVTLADPPKGPLWRRIVSGAFRKALFLRGGKTADES